jgi:transposase-like protein
MSPEKDTSAASGKAAAPTEERSPEQIRAEIEETREEMGETVAAVAAKTDVKAQAQAKVEDAKQQAQAKVEDAKEKAKAAMPESPAEAQQLAKENPKPLAIAGAVLALIVLWRLLRR